MRAYEVSTEIKQDEFYPQNVTYQTTGHIPDCVRHELQSIADRLYNHIRFWIYVSEAEAIDTMNRRLDVVLTKYHPTTAAAIRENVMFIPTP